MVPVGTHATPGFGLLTMGGVGHLSRSHGLTLDGIEELRGYRVDGQPFVLRADGGDAEAWTLMRGAAVFLAVVSEATLRTQPRLPLVMHRDLLPLEPLGSLLAAAEALPEDAGCSFLLGCPPGGDQPRLLTVAVAPQGSPGEQALQATLPCRWRDRAAGLELLPPFELPDASGRLPEPPGVQAERHRRLRTRVYSLSLERGQTARLGADPAPPTCRASRCSRPMRSELPMPDGQSGLTITSASATGPTHAPRTTRTCGQPAWRSTRTARSTSRSPPIRTGAFGPPKRRPAPAASTRPMFCQLGGTVPT